MKKKIKLTESQYNRLQKFLFENKYDNIVSKLEQTKSLDFDDKIKSLGKILGTKDEKQTYNKIESLTSKSINDLIKYADYDDGNELVNSLIKIYQERSNTFNQKKNTKQPTPTAPTQNNPVNTTPTDVNHILDFANTGDVLRFKTSSGFNVNIDVASVNHVNNEILGDNKGNKIKLTFNSYDENTKELTYLEMDKNTKQYETKTAQITNLDIIRNGNVLPIPKAGTSDYQKQNQPNNQNFLDDETPYVVDLDLPEPTDSEEEKQRKLEKQKTYGKKALDAIVNDPVLQAAFYRKPSFWQLFISDLKGQAAPGSGIVPTLELVNSYLDKKNKEKNPDLSPFKMNRKAEFLVLEPIIFKDKDGKVYEIPANTVKPYVATNTHGNYFEKNSMGDYQNANMLQSSDKDNGLGFTFRIMVKPPATKKDTFKCDIIHNYKIVYRNAEIKFLESRGYYHDKK